MQESLKKEHWNCSQNPKDYIYMQILPSKPYQDN